MCSGKLDLFYIFTQKAIERELVALLHMDFHWGKGECLSSQTGSLNPGFGNLGYRSASRDELLTGK